jgi:DNA-binding NarL/FixJ family response regulator
MTIRVFLADDHTIVRDGLSSLLKLQPDINVVGVASNGHDAVREIEKLKPDIVIMDISMPELNGIEAAKQIKEICPATQVVFLSMHSTSEHIFRALEAGARGYLLKDSAGAELVKAIRTIRSGRRYLSQKITETVIDDYLKERPETSKSPLAQLSDREREILQLVVEGRSSADIAKTLFLSAKTVETYRSRMMKKLDITDIPNLVKFAIQHGLTSLDK